MARLKCRCGTVLDDERSEETEMLFAVTAAKWRAGVRGARPDAPDGFRYSLWRCRACERWFVFEPRSTVPKVVLCEDE